MDTLCDPKGVYNFHVKIFHEYVMKLWEAAGSGHLLWGEQSLMALSEASFLHSGALPQPGPHFYALELGIT